MVWKKKYIITLRSCDQFGNYFPDDDQALMEITYEEVQELMQKRRKNHD